MITNGAPMPLHTSLIAILVGGFLLAFIFRARAPRFRWRPDPGAAAGRDRRDPADVRRRPALLAARPARSARDRGPRRVDQDRSRDPDGLGPGALPWLDPPRPHRAP